MVDDDEDTASDELCFIVAMAVFSCLFCLFLSRLINFFFLLEKGEDRV